MTIPLAVITATCYLMTMSIMHMPTTCYAMTTSAMHMPTTCYAMPMPSTTITFQDCRSSKINVNQPPYSKNNNQT